MGLASSSNTAVALCDRARSTAPATEIEADRGRRLRLGLALAGEVDEVADELGQLLELGDDVGEQRSALVLIDQVGMGQHLDVGAQAGKRGAELV